MACRDSIHVVEEPEAVPQPLGGGRKQVRPGQDVPMTGGATDAIVATATPSPIQAGAIVSRRRFQRGNVIIRGKTPRRYGMYREDVLQPNGTFKRVRRCVLLGPVSSMSERAAWKAFQPYLDRVNAEAKSQPKSGITLEQFVREWRSSVAVNLKGTFFASQAAGRVMIRQNCGRIINLSSTAGFAALPTESVYCMTKAGVTHLTKCLAVEWGKYNITVNAVAPTFIHTPGTEEYLSVPKNRADAIERIAALHRIGEPMEVAGAVVFLASDAASLITGHTILIDGGWTAR